MLYEKLSAEQRRYVDEYWAKRSSQGYADPTERWWKTRRFLATAFPISYAAFVVVYWFSLLPGWITFSLFVGFNLLAFWRMLSNQEYRKLLADGRRVLIPYKCFICLSCCYDLNTLADSGRCPECGLDYEREKVVEAWRQAYQIEERYPLSASDEGDAGGGGDRSRAKA